MQEAESRNIIAKSNIYTNNTRNKLNVDSINIYIYICGAFNLGSIMAGCLS